MLGVIIGVAAVVITISIGDGARVAVAEQITGLGSNLLIVIPGSVNLNGVRTGTGAASTLTPDDGLALVKLAHVAAVSPGAGVRTQVLAGSNNWYTQVSGVAPTYTYIRQWNMASGAFFTEADVTSSAKVCVLGQTVRTNLFPRRGIAARQNRAHSQRAVHGDRHARRARAERERDRSG